MNFFSPTFFQTLVLSDDSCTKAYIIFSPFVLTLLSKPFSFSLYLCGFLAPFLLPRLPSVKASGRTTGHLAAPRAHNFFFFALQLLFFFLLYLYLDLANPTYMWMLSCHHVNNVEFFSWPAAIPVCLMWWESVSQNKI